MSQTAAAPPPAQPAPTTAPTTAPAPPGTWGAPTGQPAGSSVVDTPRLLNRWQLIGMAVAIVFGVLASLVQFVGWQSDGRAADNAEQLVRVQEIQSNLLRADALATNGFLAGGLEDPEQRQAYDDAIDQVLEQIAEAAEAQPADEEALVALNIAVSDYTSAVAEARTNNRQGFPVGKEYLSQASNALRTDALPILTNLVDANTERAENAMNGQHPLWLLLIGILALAGLWWVNHLLARQFHRRINRGVAVAAIIVLVVTLVGAVAAWRGDRNNESLLDNELRSAIDQAAARTAANDAKANESLRLINRGSGSLYEDKWDAASAIVEDRADPDTLPDWETYVERHEQLVEYDNVDRRGPAIQIATGDGDNATTPPLTAFDEASQDLVDRMRAETTDSLRAGRELALAGVLLSLLLGIAAAVAVARGIGERRKEYA